MARNVLVEIVQILRVKRKGQEVLVGEEGVLIAATSLCYRREHPDCGFDGSIDFMPLSVFSMHGYEGHDSRIERIRAVAAIGTRRRV